MAKNKKENLELAEQEAKAKAEAAAKAEAQAKAEAEAKAKAEAAAKAIQPMLYFEHAGWCQALKRTYSPGYYRPRTKEEYEALKPFAKEPPK